MENIDGNDLSIPGSSLRQRDYCVAVTGDVFRWMVDFGNEDVLNRVSRPPLSSEVLVGAGHE